MKTLWRMSPGRVAADPRWDEGWRAAMPRLWLAVLLEPRDAWIGLYWTRPDVNWERAVDVYVCVVPFVPLKVMWRRKARLFGTWGGGWSLAASGDEREADTRGQNP